MDNEANPFISEQPLSGRLRGNPSVLAEMAPHYTRLAN
jgi:hypothetical protein